MCGALPSDRCCIDCCWSRYSPWFVGDQWWQGCWHCRGATWYVKQVQQPRLINAAQGPGVALRVVATLIFEGFELCAWAGAPWRDRPASRSHSAPCAHRQRRPKVSTKRQQESENREASLACEGLERPDLRDLTGRQGGQDDRTEGLLRAKTSVTNSE